MTAHDKRINSVNNRQDTLKRTERFCRQFNLELPILLAPMAGACPPALSVAVAEQGALGACGVLLMPPESILHWAQEFRSNCKGEFQFNNWIPDPPPLRNESHESLVREFLDRWGPEVQLAAGDLKLLDFDAQCEAMLETRPTVISSIMGLYPRQFVQRMKSLKIHWLATATTVAEAKQAEAAGADAIVAQGMEAGGHRGTFDAALAEVSMSGLFSLLPAIVDAVSIPVVATGGIADSRGIAAALLLGASAVQIGTGYLRCPEAGIPSAWADAIGQAQPHQTMLTRAFSGRLGRSISTSYARAAAEDDAPQPMPYPIQRALTAGMTGAARRNNDLDRMQAWAGQSGCLTQAIPAGELTRILWTNTLSLLS